METGNPGGIIQGPSPVAGAAGTGLNNAKSEAREGKPKPSCPSAAQTPKEALTYIDLLYKTGRMEELAAILRRSKVFREAWLILQRSFASPPETSRGAGPANLEGDSEPKYISAAVTPPAFVNVFPQPDKFTYTLTKALRIYQSQLVYFDQERNSGFRLSIRV